MPKSWVSLYLWYSVCVPITEGEFWVETGVNWTFSLVERICQYHLTQNHRILVFLNDREQVRQLSQFLTHRLREQGLLTQWITPKQCCEIICSNMNITEFERENVLYHIMEEEDFEAISYGIGFHNANLYYPIRAYIENEILESDGHLRIVCCTETLAYGINSNVDVVIIPQMIKNRPELGTSGFLFPNEYMNYAGRAGRLQEGCESGKTRYGYVYPVINSPYVFDDSSQHLQKYRKNLNEWIALCKMLKTPQLAFCHYFNLQPEEKPFYLLSLFPHTKAECQAVAVDSISFMMHCMPAPENYVLSEEEDILKPLAILENLRLLKTYNPEESGTIITTIDDERKYYQLTDVGIALTGYIISTKDYERMLQCIRESLRQDNRCTLRIFYTLYLVQKI